MIRDVEEVREVSFVDVPAQPFARLIARPMDIEALAQSLGPSFYPGVPVNCDACLEPYGGLPKPLEVALDELANDIPVDAEFDDGTT